MTFADLPAAVAVFLDANTLVYHFSRHARYGPRARDCWNESRARNWSAGRPPTC
jgi:hypothetical protein